MIKLYITARETVGEGGAVTLFEDYELNYGDLHNLYIDEEINNKIGSKIDEIYKINNQVTSPF